MECDGSKSNQRLTAPNNEMGTTSASHSSMRLNWHECITNFYEFPKVYLRILMDKTHEFPIRMEDFHHDPF